MFSDYKYGFNFSLLVSCFILFVSCEEDAEGVSTQSSGTSEDIVEGFVVDYFYDSLLHEELDDAIENDGIEILEDLVSEDSDDEILSDLEKITLFPP